MYKHAFRSLRINVLAFALSKNLLTSDLIYSSMHRLLIASLLAFCFISTTGFSQNDPIVNAGKPMSPLERHIHQTCKEVVDNNKTTDNFTEEDLADLPIGIARQVGNYIYVIAIDSAYWNGKGWFFTAYASITFPGSSRPIAFRAQNVGFNKNGLASLSATQLTLVADQYIPLGDDLVLQLPADGRNFVEFDCSGFKSVNLKGNFLFAKNLLVPDNSRTNEASVTASFEINTTDLSNIMAAVEITPFRIAGLNDVSFEVKNAVADFSDFGNPNGFSFPAGYESAFADQPQLWRGFFLEDLNVVIYNLNTEPIKLSAQHIIIDDTGVSGIAAASDVVTIEKGSADGWAFSIDQLSLQLVQNNLASGVFNGSIKVPFLGDTPIGYGAEMALENERLNYKLLVKTMADLEYTTKLSASIKLKEGSTISVERRNGKTTASAILHGSLSVSNERMQAKGIEFQDLVLMSRSPYIKPPVFSTNGLGQKAMGFPIRIENVSLKTIEEKRMSLGFDISLNFMNEESRGFSGKTNVKIFAKLDEADSSGIGGMQAAARQDWKFDGLKFNDIELTCATTAFTLRGKLSIFDNDPQYGNGFHGSLAFSIQKILPRELQVNAYFGSKEDFRYWHFDAYVPTMTIPIVPPLAINGIIGGASYKMTRKQSFSPDFSQLGAAGSSGNNTAQSDYVPDAKAGISFMAGVTLIAGNEKAFNSDAVLEVALNTSGGLRYAQFKGAGYFLTSTESRGRATDSKPMPAPVFADLNMIYDHDNGVFHANLKTYLNLEGKVRGIGPNNMMGEAVIHVDAHDWYIYIGRPSQMLGVDIANLAVAQGYFMAGTQIEQMPPPPPELREIINERDEALVQDETTLALGRGFSTGLRFQTGYDSKDKIKPFYAMFSIGAGTDLMIRDFGNASCSGSHEKIGFDGWYASGQAYVFLKGKVGIKVKGKKFDFLSLGAAALLQAKLPNPTWLKGTMAGRYSVLGGLVSGKFNVKIIVGEECEITTPGSELGDIVVISDLTPDAGSNDVSVFTAPQVTFNTAIDSELSMLNNEDELNTYRVVLDELNIKHNGQNLAGTREWNAKKDVLAFRTFEILPPQASLRAFVKIHWEKKLSNGNWEALKENNVTDYETKEVNFTTGAAPDFIPEENVVYSYPVKNQYNFLPKEYGQGYVKLRHGQAYLFQQSPGDSISWSYFARFQEPLGESLEMPVTYNISEATVNLHIPDGLKHETVYKFTFVKKPVSSGQIDKNVKRDNVKKEAGEGNEVSVRSNTLEGTLVQNLEKEIYTSAFRTSRYDNFTEKLAAASSYQDMFDVAIGNIAVIGKRITLPETFDDIELLGKYRRHKPLVQLSASGENHWLKNVISPILYDTYPLDPAVSITRRNLDSLGVKPVRALALSNQVENYLLSESNITSGISVPKSGPVKAMYYLSYISFGDYDELRNKAAARTIAGGQIPSAVTRLLQTRGYTDLMSGSYPINISYSLPGKDQITTQKQIIIQF